MNRRSILKGLLALPFAPLLAKAAKAAPLDIKQVARVANIDVCDLAPSSSDQTSIYMTEWGPPMTAGEITRRNEKRMLELAPVFERLNKQSWNTQWHDVSEHILPKKNWLKRAINGN